MAATNRKTPETLNHLIRRIIADCRAVGHPCTPELLAQAIDAAGWKHPTAPTMGPNRGDQNDPTSTDNGGRMSAAAAGRRGGSARRRGPAPAETPDPDVGGLPDDTDHTAVLEPTLEPAELKSARRKLAAKLPAAAEHSAGRAIDNDPADQWTRPDNARSVSDYLGAILEHIADAANVKWRDDSIYIPGGTLDLGSKFGVVTIEPCSRITVRRDRNRVTIDPINPGQPGGPVVIVGGDYHRTPLGWLRTDVAR